MRAAKVYEHPEFSSDQVDFSVLSTINLILVLVLVAAVSIAAMSWLVVWADHSLCKPNSLIRAFRFVLTRWNRSRSSS